MIDKQLIGLMRLVMELKKRRIFNSIVITNTGVQIGYWDRGERKPVITDEFGARMYLNALRENERRALEREAWRDAAHAKMSKKGAEKYDRPQRRGVSRAAAWGEGRNEPVSEL